MTWIVVLLFACTDPYESLLEHGQPAELGPDWSIPFGSSRFDATDKKRVTTFESFAEPYLYVHAYRGEVEGIDLMLPSGESVENLRAAWGPPSSTFEVKELPQEDIRSGVSYVAGEGRAETWMRGDGDAVATLWTTEGRPGRVTLRPWWGLDKAIAGLPRCEHFPGLADQPLQPGIEGPKYGDRDPAKHGPRMLPAVGPLDAGSKLEFYVDTIVWQVHDPDGALESAVRARIEALPEDADGRRPCEDKAGSLFLRRSGSRLDVMARPFLTPDERAARQAAAEAAKPKTALEAAERQAIVTSCFSDANVALELEFGVKDGKVTSPRVYDVRTSFSNAPAPRRPRTDAVAKCLVKEAKSWFFDESFEEEKLQMQFGARAF